MRRSQTPNVSADIQESYLESLSDLLVGLLFIFIIILMSFALNLRVAQEATAKVERHLSDAGSLRSDLLTSIQKGMNAQHIRVYLDPKNGVVRLPEDLLFESGSATISPQGQLAMAKLARRLVRILPCYARGIPRSIDCPPESHPVLDAMFIEGHTDDIQMYSSEFKNNWELSAARSKNAFDALVTASPALEHIKNEANQPLLSISAYGDTRPVAGFKTKQETRRHSRRLDLRFIVGTPSVEDVRL
jgi:chemotaxis protein MotB